MTLDRYQSVRVATQYPRMVTNGTPIELCTFDDVLDAVAQRLDSVGPPLALGSVNLDHIHHFRGTPQSLNTIDTDRADLEWAFLADGAPIVSKANKLTGREWPRVTGADLLPELVDLAASTSHTVGFLGGTGRMHERLRFALRRSHPELEVGGFWSPEREQLADLQFCARLAAQISAAKVDILVVGLGKPRQELWIQRFGVATGARVLLAFGASADFLAGEAERAPQFFQDSGLEWLYRLAKEPTRLSRRYLLEGPRALVQLQKARIEVSPESPLHRRHDVMPPSERSLLGGLP